MHTTTARNVIREGKKSKEKVDVFSYELLAYRTLINGKAMPYGTSDEEALPDYFMSSENIMPQSPRRYSGRSTEVGRFFNLQDNQCAN